VTKATQQQNDKISTYIFKDNCWCCMTKFAELSAKWLHILLRKTSMTQSRSVSHTNSQNYNSVLPYPLFISIKMFQSLLSWQKSTSVILLRNWIQIVQHT